MLLENYEKFTVVESSLSRILQHINNPKSQFGHISAFRGDLSKEQNKVRHKNLKDVITGRGLGYIEMSGGYREEGGPVEELSLFVPEIEKDDLVILGQRYDQYSVIWKGDGVFQEIGTNERSGAGKVLNNFHAGMDTNPMKVRQYWSKLLRGRHKDKSFLYVMERRSANWWTEWRISTRQNGDDSELWVRIA